MVENGKIEVVGLVGYIVGVADMGARTRDSTQCQYRHIFETEEESFTAHRPLKTSLRKG